MVLYYIFIIIIMVIHKTLMYILRLNDDYLLCMGDNRWIVLDVPGGFLHCIVVVLHCLQPGRLSYIKGHHARLDFNIHLMYIKNLH